MRNADTPVNHLTLITITELVQVRIRNIDKTGFYYRCRSVFIKSNRIPP